MAEMSMNKAIHGAFRRDVERFSAALAAFSDGDRQRAAQLETAWANFDTQLVKHHEGEHKIAWPALEAVGVSVETIGQMDAEHEVMAQALAGARSAMRHFASTASAADAQTALAAVQNLQTAMVTHLDHEEAEFEPVFFAKHDSPEIKEMGKKFSKEAGLSEGGQFFAWVLDGATPAERAAVTGNIPGPVLAVINGIFGRKYRKTVATVWTS